MSDTTSGTTSDTTSSLPTPKPSSPHTPLELSNQIIHFPLCNHAYEIAQAYTIASTSFFAQPLQFTPEIEDLPPVTTCPDAFCQRCAGETDDELVERFEALSLGVELNGKGELTEEGYRTLIEKLQVLERED